MSSFNKDIVLDEEAFDKAVSDFVDLGVRIQTLRADIESMLQLLQEGLDSPAGRKLVNSCRTNLLKPLEDQKAVLNHISDTLRESKTQYSTVFRAYESLQTKIQQRS